VIIHSIVNLNLPQVFHSKKPWQTFTAEMNRMNLKENMSIEYGLEREKIAQPAAVMAIQPNKFPINQL
jgi:hypothetical protein